MLMQNSKKSTRDKHAFRPIYFKHAHFKKIYVYCVKSVLLNMYRSVLHTLDCQMTNENILHRVRGIPFCFLRDFIVPKSSLTRNFCTERQGVFRFGLARDGTALTSRYLSGHVVPVAERLDQASRRCFSALFFISLSFVSCRKFSQTIDLSVDRYSTGRVPPRFSPLSDSLNT